MICSVGLALDIFGKLIAVGGFVTAMIALAKYTNETRKKQFEKVFNKIKVAKNNSAQELLNYYKGKYKGDEKQKKETELASSVALVIKKDWDCSGMKSPNEPFLLLDDFIPEKTSNDLDDIRKQIPTQSCRSYVENLQLYGLTPSTFFNGDLYCASSFKSNNGTGEKPEFKVYKAKYFDFMNTCIVKEYLYEKGDRCFLKDDIFTLTNRACGIGIDTLTVIKLKNEDSNGYEFVFLMHERSKNVAEGVGAVHVVPAGSYQPFVSIEKDRQTSQVQPDVKAEPLSTTVYREFCEEVLSTSHMRELSSEQYLYGNKAYNFLKGKDPKCSVSPAKLYFLGMGLDPYSTKMEVLTLLYIDISENSCFERFLKLLKRKKKNTETPNKTPTETTSKSISQKEKLEQAFGDAEACEGEIQVEAFSKASLEEYYGNANITSAAKELIYIVYDKVDELIDEWSK